MSKVYSYEDCQPVIKEAFKKAIDHLKETLGDQYSMNATKFAWGKFQGYAERSSAKDGLVPTNTLGSLVLKYNDTTFSCGTGFDDKLRKEIWDNKELYLGKLASIRYMSVGSKDLPRVPSFQGFRDIEDM